MKLKVVQHEQNVFTIQKMYLSKWSSCFPDSVKNVPDSGRFALVPISDVASCVCKIFFRREIHPFYVYIDPSVYHLNNIKDESLPRTSLHMNDICNDNMQLLPQLISINKLTLSVVFENISNMKKWQNEQEKLKGIVLEILKLFVVTNKCIVLLRNLTECLRHDIHALVIHSSSHCGSEVTPGQVTSNTIIESIKVASKLRFQQLQEDTVTKVAGLDDAITILTDVIKNNLLHRHNGNTFSLKPTKQILLTGPPGCGKTSLVKQVSSDCNATLLVVLGPEVLSSKPGSTEEALKKVFENAAILAEEDEDAVCILLLDEIDSLCARRDLNRTSSHSIRATVQLLALLEQADKTPGLVVIATTNKPFLLDPSLRRPGRLEREVHVGVPSETDRESILLLLLKPVNPPEISTLAKYVASLTPGYVGADLAFLCQEVSLVHVKRKTSNVCEVASVSCWMNDFKRSVTKFKPSVLRSGLGIVLTSPLSMDSIGGLDNIKKELRVAVQWPLTHPDAFTRMGLPQPKGVLLYGPPGCAKTSLARAMATETNTNFLAVSAADLYSPYVGEAERSIVDLFRRARAGAPTILFIDEIDALVGSRGNSERSANESILSTLLTEMDGVGVKFDDSSLPSSSKSGRERDGTQQSLGQIPAFVSRAAGVIIVAATNRPDKLDDAILRPGRLDKLVYVPAPNVMERFDILKCVTFNMPLAECVDLSYLAEHTNLYSGADLSQLAKEAALIALTEGGMTANQITQSHFEAALQTFRPSLSEEQLSWYENYSGKNSTERSLF